MIKNPTSRYYNPDAKIVLITQPPVNEVQWKKRCDDNGDRMNRTAEVAKAYAEAAREIAGQHQVPVCDLWTELMQLVGEETDAECNGQDEIVEVASKTCYAEEKFYKRDLSEFLLDGLHLNSNGNLVSESELLKVNLGLAVKARFGKVNGHILTPYCRFLLVLCCELSKLTTLSWILKPSISSFPCGEPCLRQTTSRL